jgi:hypothetical protein
MKISDIDKRELRDRSQLKISDVTNTSEPSPARTVFVPETGNVLGYGGDRSTDEIRFDVQTSELRRDPDGFFGHVDISPDLVQGIGGVLADSVVGTAKGLGSFAVQQLPMSAAGIVDEFYASRKNFELLDIWDAMTGNPLSMDKVLKMASPTGRRGLEKEADAVSRMTDRLNNKIAEVQALRPQGAVQEFTSALGSGVASLATSLGLWRYTKNKKVPAILFGGIAKGTASVRAKEKDLPIEQRKAISSAVGFGEGALELLALDMWAKMVRGNSAISHVLRAGGRSTSEGVTEFLQELSSETILKVTQVSDEDWGNVVKQAGFGGLIGMIIGGGTSFYSSFVEKNHPTLKPLREAGLNDKEIEQVYEAVESGARQKAEPVVESIITEEMAQTDHMMEQEVVQKPVEEKPKKVRAVEGLADLYKRVTGERSKKRFETMQKHDPQEAGKRAKAAGMEQSAIVRKLRGEPTGIEIKKEVQRLTSNYVGKKVQTPDGEGVVSGPPAFGRVKVKYPDGTEKFVSGGDVTSEIATDKMAIESLRKSAEQEARRELQFAGIPTEKQPKELESVFVEEKVEKKPKEAKKKEEVKKPEEAKEAPKAEKVPTERKPIKTKAKKKESKAFQRVKEKMKALSGESALYTPITLAEQTSLGMQFVEEQPEAARRVALGIEPPPPGVTNAAISIAYADMLENTGNLKEFTDVVRARSLRQTRNGQEIVMERGKVDEHSTDHYIQLVLESRLALAGKRLFDVKIAVSEDKTKESSIYKDNVKRGEAKLDQETNILKEQVDAKTLDLAQAQKLIDGIIC